MCVLTKYLVRRVIVNIIVQETDCNSALVFDDFLGRLTQWSSNTEGNKLFLCDLNEKVNEENPIAADIHGNSQVGNIYILSFQDSIVSGYYVNIVVNCWFSDSFKMYLFSREMQMSLLERSAGEGGGGKGYFLSDRCAKPKARTFLSSPAIKLYTCMWHILWYIDNCYCKVKYIHRFTMFREE